MRFLLILSLCLLILAFSPLAHAGEGTQHKSPKPSLNAHEVACLASNMYFEARNQGSKGMEAVGHVTLNRLRAGFAPSVCAIVWQKVGSTCQFSWTCDHEHHVTEPALAHKSVALAQKLLWGYALDNTQGATYYHTKDLDARHASWFRHKLKHLGTIGEHVFFAAMR